MHVHLGIARGEVCHHRCSDAFSQQVEAALTLVREGEMSAAMSRLHSLGIADLTPGVLQQLIAKHPTDT